MRNELVGYLLNALDDDETRAVEAALAAAPQNDPLRRELDVLRRAIEPLGRDRLPCDPPPGLAARTLRFVAVQTATASDPIPGADGGMNVSAARY